jgi:hypothetical protein
MLIDRNALTMGQAATILAAAGCTMHVDHKIDRKWHRSWYEATARDGNGRIVTRVKNADWSEAVAQLCAKLAETKDAVA